jgi:hypothetical protein
VHELIWVAAAGAAGFAGNELAARYRIRVGSRIGSAALVADGHHARTDGFTSLAVVAGAGGVALGWPAADPVVGLMITVAIFAVLRGAVRDIYRRLQQDTAAYSADGWLTGRFTGGHRGWLLWRQMCGPVRLLVWCVAGWAGTSRRSTS